MTTITLTMTGAGTWVVPAGVTEVEVWAWGGGQNGGLVPRKGYVHGTGGGFAKSLITVSAGQTLYYYVGGLAEPSWVNKAASSAPTSATNGVVGASGGSGIGQTVYAGGVATTTAGGGGAGSAGAANGATPGSPDGGSGATSAAPATPPGGGGYAGTTPRSAARGEIRIIYTAAPSRRPIRTVQILRG